MIKMSEEVPPLKKLRNSAIPSVTITTVQIIDTKTLLCIKTLTDGSAAGPFRQLFGQLPEYVDFEHLLLINITH